MSHSAATSSSASPAAVFNESSSIDEGEVSSDLANHSDDEDDNSTSDEEADDDDDDDFDLESIFRRDARDIQNRTSRAVGTAAMEDRRFRELFGASISVILHVWNAMVGGGLLPEKSVGGRRKEVEALVRRLEGE